MARNKGTFNFAANFQVKMQEALDPRVVVGAKADLINKETWPYDGDTIYLYEGLIVGVAAEKAAYMLVDATKITEADYSGWSRIDAGAASNVEIVDNLESDASDKALSAAQGKVLMNEINTVAGKLSGVYTYKGSKATFAELPAEGNVSGDVWNVEEAHDGHPAGTNWAWNGSEWDALAGSIDLSNYFNKEEVNAAIKVETDRATAEEGRLALLIEANTTAAATAQAKADANEGQINSISQSIGEINLVLNGTEESDEDGVVGRLALVETKNESQDTRLTNLEKLVSGGEAGEGGTTLLEMVNQNAADIAQLKLDMDTIEADYLTSADKQELQQSINTSSEAITALQTSVGETPVSQQIDEALAWEDVE